MNFTLWISAYVAVWWLSNTVTTIASKRMMLEPSSAPSPHLSTAFRDVRWMELTIFQHALGALLSLLWLKFGRAEAIPWREAVQTPLALAAAGNVVGNLATNAAYAAVSAGLAQVVKACEPLAMYGLLAVMKRDVAPSPGVLFAIVLMVSGAASFVLHDVSFNVWGTCAAILANLAFPLRNIYLKWLPEPWNDALLKYCVISVYSAALLLPVWLIKVVVVGFYPFFGSWDGTVSSGFHFVYNVASIAVLQSVSPLTHSILNMSKRLFVIVANITYFATPVSWIMAVGLLVLCVGYVLYFVITNNIKTTVSCNLAIGCALCIAIPALWQVQTLQHGLTAESMRVNSHNTTNMFRGAPFGHAPGATEATSMERVSSVWAYTSPLPEHAVVQLVEKLSGRPVVLYCGTTECVKAAESLRLDSLSVEFLQMKTLLKDTPLGPWLARHPLHKVLAGRKFEEQLQTAAKYGVLWRYGGLYVDLLMNITGSSLPKCSSPWVITPGKARGDSHHGPLDCACFQSHHPLLETVMKAYVRIYSDAAKKATASSVLQIRYDSIENKILREVCKGKSSVDCPETLDVKLTKVARAPGRLTHYGTLSFDTRSKLAGVVNIGNEVQGFPGHQFVPYIDIFVDSYTLGRQEPVETITAFFNGWWGGGIQWPPLPNVHPIMLAFHAERSMHSLLLSNITHTRSMAPIGCRDTDTCNFLEKQGVEAYFSGCLTLMLQNPNYQQPRTDDIYLVDVTSAYKKLIPKHILDKAITVQHNWYAPERMDNAARFAEAFRLMDKYSRAKLIITQRIHAGLPSVGMGTPVLFINSAAMPGGGGSRNVGSTRTMGLTPLFHTLDMYQHNESSAKSWMEAFSWDRVPANPGLAMFMRFRATFWNVIRRHQDLRDTAYRLGVIPLQLPTDSESQESSLIFHMVIAKDAGTTAPLESKADDQNSCDIGYVQWRALESIFHHHPRARVVIHSNHVGHSCFLVLTEVGYQLHVQTYDVASLLYDSPASGFRKPDSSRKKLETTILPLLLLYQHGGIYVGGDVIVTRPCDNLGPNVLSWTNEEQMNVNFMKFESKHRFLKEVLTYIASVNPQMEFISELHDKFSKNTDGLELLGQDEVYRFPDGARCSKVLTGEKLEQLMTRLGEKAYAVQIPAQVLETPPPITESTVCKRLINEFCVLCDVNY